MSSTLKLQSTKSVKDLITTPEVVKAFGFFETKAQQIDEEHIRISSVPASPFSEVERAEYLRSKFLELGLEQVSLDKEGIVLVCLPVNLNRL